MKRLTTKKTLALLLSVLLLVTVAVSVFAISASAAATATEGRNFKGANAASNKDQRLELTKTLTDIPLTWEAVIKVNGTANADCKGTIFGQWSGGSGANCFANFEIYNGASPTLC